MLKPDLAVLRCMMLLRGSGEFQTFQRWLEASLADVDQKLRTAEDSHLLRLQGEAQCLESMLRRIETAPDVAKKYS